MYVYIDCVYIRVNIYLYPNQNVCMYVWVYVYTFTLLHMPSTSAYAIHASDTAARLSPG